MIIHFKRRGDFLETAGEGAEITARVCGLTMTRNRITGEHACGIPVWSYTERFAELERAGFDPVWSAT